MSNRIKYFQEFVNEGHRMEGEDLDNLRDMMSLRPRRKKPEAPVVRLGKLLRLGYELGFGIAPNVAALATDVLNTGIYTIVKTVNAQGKRVRDESFYKGVDIERSYPSRQDAEDALSYMEDEPVYVSNNRPGASFSSGEDPHDGAYYNDGSRYVVSEVVAFND